MSTHAFALRQHIARLTPTEAEIRFSIHLPANFSAARIRGRLTGPRCPYSSTVEVAYPLRELGRESAPQDGVSVLLRCMIPEPCAWDPQSPFLYRGMLDIEHADVTVHQRQVQIGFVSWGLGTRGLRVNSKYMRLRSVFAEALDPDRALRWREAGINCLVVDPVRARPGLWDSADQHGFFVLARARDAAAIAQVRVQEARPSFLGWILQQELLPAVVASGIEGTAHTGSAPLVGLEVSEVPSAPIPGVSFLVAPSDVVHAKDLTNLPWLRVQPEDNADESNLPSGVLGTLRLNGSDSSRMN